MKDFAGKIAVITGGGTGMGRELARQLVAEGCSVAMCDVSAENMAETQRQCQAAAPQGTRVMTFVADVSDEGQILKFRDAVARELDTDHIHLLFNNAGIGGGPSFINSPRDEWEKTFNVCWYGVYYATRAFIGMILKASEAHIVNTSSVNGFWASLGPTRAHTAYPAAKFAVKGFTEGLINDLRLNAPHVKCSVVMPGHIGTAIMTNSRRILSGHGAEEMSAAEIAEARKGLKAMGMPVDMMTDLQITQMIAELGRQFETNAPTTAADAATTILNGVREEKWRILVGADAHVMDRLVRSEPEEAYEQGFIDKLRAEGHWRAF
ncbi:MAG: SDR family NAD(P)-dependent oxidoreductase [Alphaproteobacteria bacterium]|jgi:NAD(P)-dependent dehydrogenase (short-subunit alcohol dehydrogenase family)